MKGLQITAPEQAEVREFPIPEPMPGEVLVQVSGVTTCPQWDLHVYYGRPMFAGGTLSFPYPVGQPGHEMTGVVAAIGAGVMGFKPGDTVSAWRDPGQVRQGCYAQYVALAQEHLIQVPAGMEPAHLAPLELGMCLASTILELKRVDALRGRKVGISGLGPAGLVAAQMVRSEGAAEVVGLDISAMRREFARSFGFDDILDPRQETGLPARNQRGALDVSIDCVGYKESAEYLMAHTRQMVAWFGVQREPYRYTDNTLSLLGYPGHHRAAAEYALNQVVTGKLNLARMVTHHFPLEEYDHAVKLLKAQEAVKVCFLPW